MPSLWCGFCFEVECQLWNLNLGLSVYLRSATFRLNLSFVPIFLHGIVGGVFPDYLKIFLMSVCFIKITLSFFYPFQTCFSNSPIQLCMSLQRFSDFLTLPRRPIGMGIEVVRFELFQHRRLRYLRYQIAVESAPGFLLHQSPSKMSSSVTIGAVLITYLSTSIKCWTDRNSGTMLSYTDCSRVSRPSWRSLHGLSASVRTACWVPSWMPALLKELPMVSFYTATQEVTRNLIAWSTDILGTDYPLSKTLFIIRTQTFQPQAIRNREVLLFFFFFFSFFMCTINIMTEEPPTPHVGVSRA